MKKISLIMISVLALALVAGCGGQEEEVVIEPSWSGGAAFEAGNITSLASLVADPSAFVDQNLTLKGEVTGVCKGSGCWVQLTDADGNSFYAKSLDHSLSFPEDCTGKTAIVNGTMLEMAAQGHDGCKEGEEGHDHDHDHDHDHGEEGEEAHTCPSPTYLVNIAGAQLL